MPVAVVVLAQLGVKVVRQHVDITLDAECDVIVQPEVGTYTAAYDRVPPVTGPQLLEVDAEALVGFLCIVIVVAESHASTEKRIDVEDALNVAPEEYVRQVSLHVEGRLDEVPLVRCLRVGVVVTCPEAAHAQSGTDEFVELVANGSLERWRQQVAELGFADVIGSACLYGDVPVGYKEVNGRCNKFAKRLPRLL